MKESKPPTPPSDPSPKATAERTLARDPQSHWHKTAFRIVIRQAQPTTIALARELAMESIGRAQSVATALEEYLHENSSVDGECACQVVEVIDDLCNLVSGLMLDWWEDEPELISHGWTPPTDKGGQS
jgi:hypothetical protein